MDGIIGGVVGGVLAGIFSVFAVFLTNEHNQKLNDLKSFEEVLHFLRAVRAEIKCLFERSQRAAGKAIAESKEGEPLLVTHSAQEQYFSIFNSNGEMLGRLDDEPLQAQIVSLYVAGKGLLDTLRVNCELVRDYLEIEANKENPVTMQTKQHLAARINGLIACANQLRQEQLALQEVLPGTLAGIDAYERKLLAQINSTRQSMIQNWIVRGFKWLGF